MNAQAQTGELMEVTADNAPAIYGMNKLSDFVAKAREAVIGEVPDLTTRKGRERIASLAAQVSRSKTAVEKPGRDYLKRIKELPKSIEAELREYVQQMDALRDEVRAPLTEWEQAEADRIARHQGNIDYMKLRLECRDLDSAELKANIATIEGTIIGEHWQEFEAEAHRVKADSLAALRDALAKREKHEAELAAIAKFNAEQAEREQKERDERIAREAAEKAQREAEQRANAERDAAAKREANAKAAAERRELELTLQAERAEREKVEAQQRAEAQAKAAAAAERQRIADEQARAERETKAREADKAHRRTVNRAALEAFTAGGMPEACAKQAIELIAKGLIPGIAIRY